MRHKVQRGKLSRNKSWRAATVNSLVRNLLIQQSIKTTLTRAKAARSLVEQIISLAKDNSLAAKRRVFQILGDHKLVSLLFSQVGPRFAKRAGGYTRIIPVGMRRGDNANVVIFELTEIKKKEVKKHVAKPKETKGEHKTHVSEATQGEHAPEVKHETNAAVKEKPPVTQKPTKKFLGGLKNIFKKERDSL